MRGSLCLVGLVGLSACDFVGAYETYKRNVAAQTADAGDADAGVDAGVMCAPSTDPDACGRCTDEQCCSELAACRGEPRCGDFYKSCLPGCRADGGTYSSCTVYCDSINGAGHAIFAPYAACNIDRCLTECSLPNTPSPCAVCLKMNCAAIKRSCESDRHCVTLQECLNVCTDTGPSAACDDACYGKVTAETRKRFDDMVFCSFSYCRMVCG